MFLWLLFVCHSFRVEIPCDEQLLCVSSQLRIQRCHVGGLKSALVGVWKVADIQTRLLNFCQHSSGCNLLVRQLPSAGQEWWHCPEEGATGSHWQPTLTAAEGVGKGIWTGHQQFPLYCSASFDVLSMF